MQLLEYVRPGTAPDQPARWMVRVHVWSMTCLVGVIGTHEPSPFGDETLRHWSIYLGPFNVGFWYLLTPRTKATP